MKRFNSRFLLIVAISMLLVAFSTSYAFAHQNMNVLLPDQQLIQSQQINPAPQQPVQGYYPGSGYSPWQGSGYYGWQNMGMGMGMGMGWCW